MNSGTRQVNPYPGFIFFPSVSIVEWHLYLSGRARYLSGMRVNLLGWGVLCAATLLTSCASFTGLPTSHPVPVKALPEHTAATYFYHKGDWYQFRLTLESSDRIVSDKRRERVYKELKAAPSMFRFNPDTEAYDSDVSPGCGGARLTLALRVEGREPHLKMFPVSSTGGGGPPQWPGPRGMSIECVTEPAVHGQAVSVRDKEFTVAAQATVTLTEREQEAGMSEVVFEVKRVWKAAISPEDRILLTEVTPFGLERS